MTECGLGFGHEARILASAADRARARGADVVGVDVAKALPEACEAVHGPVPGRVRKVALLRQALGEAHGLPDTIDDGELAVPELADDHVKGVRAEVDGCDDRRRVGVVTLVRAVAHRVDQRRSVPVRP